MVRGWQGDSQSPLGEMVSELLWTLGFAQGGGHVLCQGAACPLQTWKTVSKEYKNDFNKAA